MFARPAFLLISLILITQIGGTSSTGNPDLQIRTFNRKFLRFISNSDHAGMLALWADDGVDLMPGEPPLVGKTAITAWLIKIESGSGGAKVVKEELQFHDLRVSGDWAFEWATEHQVVQSPGNPASDEYGKIALILHRDQSGVWRIQQEMWNDMPQPQH